MNNPPDIKEFTDKALKEQADKLDIPFAMDFAGGLAVSLKPLWQSLGKLENSFLEDSLSDIPLTNSVYVSGIARSGTTIILESLFQSNEFAAHRYRDYPFIDIPHFWRKWTSLFAKVEEPAQRAHLDRLEITTQSPEALEEMLWMDFFDELHKPELNNVLTDAIENTAFETYYSAHIKKLLKNENKSRYLAKGNYNLTRIRYINKLYPDAKFIIAIRRPEAHIASLLKQHYLFSQIEKKNNRVLKYMNRIGHYEFGLNFTPVNIGDNSLSQKIMSLMNNNHELEALAHYWAMVYEYIYHDILNDDAINSSVLLVRYEDLCKAPLDSLKNIQEFCNLSKELNEPQSGISAPSYYSHGFSSEQTELIKNVTEKTKFLYYKD